MGDSLPPEISQPSPRTTRRILDYVDLPPVPSPSTSSLAVDGQNVDKKGKKRASPEGLEMGESPTVKRRTSITPSRPPSESRNSSSSLSRNFAKVKISEGQGRYWPRPDETPETEGFYLPGEDGITPFAEGQKPIRYLSDFEIFNPANSNKFVSLEAMDDEHSSVDTQWEAVGLAQAVPKRDPYEDDQNDSADMAEPPTERLKLGAIYRYHVDYTESHGPIYVETQCAWYILGEPFANYREIYSPFYRRQKILQALISTAYTEPDADFKSFKKDHVGRYDQYISFTEYDFQQDLTDDVDDILDGLAPDVAAELNSRTLIKAYRAFFRQSRPSKSQKKRRAARTHSRISEAGLFRPENLERTRCTPWVAFIARPYFKATNHRWVVVGEGHLPQASTIDGPVEESIVLHPANRRHLQRLLSATRAERPRVSVRKEDINEEDAGLLDALFVGGVKYTVGDTVIVLPEHCKAPSDESEAPNGVIGDFFWFGDIVKIQRNGEVHLHYYEHARKTVMADFGHPQELFLTRTHGDVNASCILSKALVRRCQPDNRPTSLRSNDYFYCFMYDSNNGSFTTIDETVDLIRGLPSPDNCLGCLQEQELDRARKVQVTFNGDGDVATVRKDDVLYHVLDSVLFQTGEGKELCSVGKIIKIIATPVAEDSDESDEEYAVSLTVRKYARIADFSSYDKPITEESAHHLFSTDEEVTVNLVQIKAKAFVLFRKTVRREVSDLKAWCRVSPVHFFVTHKADMTYDPPSVKSYSEDNDPYCLDCVEPMLSDYRREWIDFPADASKTPLQVFDVFAGIGGLSLGMAEAGLMKLTHAIELSESAAATLRTNSPESHVFSKCANLMLEHAVEQHIRGQHQHPNVSLPRPGDVDCLVAGFPCQPHSSLNMYRRADDQKNECLLTTLSYFDVLRPPTGVLENVKGFLSFRLNGEQDGDHRIVGGIDAGGLKLIVKVFLIWGYQVRFAFLQAGHYGTPQNRVRFIMLVAKHGFELPQLPAQTHHFSPSNWTKDSLNIKVPGVSVLKSVTDRSDAAALPTVNIGDAIGDLKQWEWENPHVVYEPRAESQAPEGSALEQVRRREGDWNLGPSTGAAYEHGPQSAFQARCRRQEPRSLEDLQHYTQCLNDHTIETVCNIRLDAKADYRSLRPGLAGWQMVNPQSSTAKRNYPPGLYGRLDSAEHFRTIVTNINPTAKQSWVIHPWCKRIISVREVARAQGFPDHFRFVSLDRNVKTLHRQIANAVPFPMAEAIGREVVRAWYKTRQANPPAEVVAGEDEEMQVIALAGRPDPTPLQ